MTSWAVALDEFEARLDAQRAALDAGSAGSLVPFEPPIGLGPLPTALADRAHDLLDQARDLEQELADNVNALAVDLAVVRKVGSSTAEVRPATFIDFTA